MKQFCYWLQVLCLSMFILAGVPEQDHLLDGTMEEKLRGILKRLGDDDWKTRRAAQKELEDLIDTDAQAELVKKVVEESDSLDLKERVNQAIVVYEWKKHEWLVYRGADFNLWSLSLQGGRAVKITSNWRSFTPRWSPNGKQIVYSAERGDNKLNVISIMDVDSGSDVWLTEGGDDVFPSFSPDGRRIVFERFFKEKGEIYLTDVDGESITQLTTGDSDDSLPIFSPDGKKIVFVSNRGEGWRIYTMDIDGKNQERLTANDGEERSPTFSPDGKGIAFAYKEKGENKWKLYLMDTDGKNITKLYEGNADCHSPMFSPDGKKIVFMATTGKTDWRMVESNGHICVIDADGKNVKDVGEGYYPSWRLSLLPIKKKEMEQKK